MKKQTHIVAFIERPNQPEDRREWAVIPHWQDAMHVIIRPILARGIELSIKEFEDGSGARISWMIGTTTFRMFFSVKNMFTDVDTVRDMVDGWNRNELLKKEE